MNIGLDTLELIDFYSQHLKNNVLKFWLERGIDYDEGGYYTCFDNTGKQLLSNDKYTWSQGRMVWIFSRLASMKGSIFSEDECKRFIALAAHGADFLMKNCLLGNGNCTFLMDRTGKPKEEIKGEGFDTSVFADCFAVCGLAKYSEVSRDKNVLDFAVRLYTTILERIDCNDYKLDPYPVPEGYKFHGIFMTLLNVSQELDDAIKSFRYEDYGNLDILLKSRILACLDEITGNFIKEDGILHEMIGLDNKEMDSLLGRYINPGHSIEDMWFVIHSADELGKPAYITKACEVVKKMFDLGWDKEYGGLLLFADKTGGSPQGGINGIENSPMLKKVMNDWDSKLWWPHSEALYSTLLCYKKTQNPLYLDLYRKVHDYTFNTFPSPDKNIGEWIQIRGRKGDPEQKVVALPVKDPFHIIRNIILIIELLEAQVR